MFYIAEYKMHEREPARESPPTPPFPFPFELMSVWLFGSVVALAAGQAVLFIASQPLCEVNQSVD